MDYIDIIEKSIYNIDSKICGIIDDYRVLQEPQKVADYVIQFLRTYLEHIAARIYAYENPNEQVPIRGKDKWYTQYMKQLKESNEYGYIWRMHHSLQISTSHYVPAEDGAIRLMDGYLPQLYHLRDQMRDKFGLLLLSNFEDYPQEKSCELDSYYEKIYIALKAIDLEDSKEHTNDRYYITRKKYRTVNGKGFFEYTLSYAQEEITKFDRFVAYSFNDIPDNYSIQCDFYQSNIDFNGVGIDIKCLIAWNVAIRPCELEKLARICGYDIVVKSDNLYYKALMKFLSRTGMNLLDILLADNEEYEIYIQQIELSIMSSLSLQWATGKALCEILNNSRYEGDDGADNIDSTIELLQNTISYNLPLLLKPLYDMKQSESPFLKCMQVGAFGVVERCMIEMGVPRESALYLYKEIFDEKEIKVENRLELEQIIREKIRLEYKNIPYWIQVQLDFLI